MTSEEWKKLPHEEQKVIVAELAGWKYTGGIFLSKEKCDGFWRRPGTDPGSDEDQLGLTDLTQDLNAIIEAVIAQDSLGFWNRYVSYLNLVVNGVAKSWKEQEDYFNTTSQFKLINASAEQRAEAYVLAMTE